MGIADGSLQQSCAHPVLCQVIGCARLHGFDVRVVIVLAGGENERCGDAALICNGKQFEAGFIVEPVIEQAGIVMSRQEFLQPGIEVQGGMQLVSGREKSSKILRTIR